jgi:hypothetical protein
LLSVGPVPCGLLTFGAFFRVAVLTRLRCEFLAFFDRCRSIGSFVAEA